MSQLEPTLLDANYVLTLEEIGAPQMFRLYDRHRGSGWHEHGAEARIWERIEDVDDGELWETHLSLKARLLGFVHHRAVEQAERRGESQESLRRLARVLSPDALTVGFARRFATYKRANLILADIEMLAFMVNDPKRPVQFVFATISTSGVILSKASMFG
jgi:glycogen phosphorylase